MTKKKQYRGKAKWWKYWGVGVGIICILVYVRVFFGDIYNVLYSMENWGWWWSLYTGLNMLFLIAITVVTVFAVKGMMSGNFNSDFRSVLRLILVMCGLSLGITSFSQLVIKSFEAVTKGTLEYQGECSVSLHHQRRSSDDYFLWMDEGENAGKTIRITYHQFLTLAPVKYVSRSSTYRCTKNARVQYLQGLTWPVEFETY